jgi:hypothetical protein
MLVLLDENLPHSLRLLLAPHDVRTVDYQGWKSLTNGSLIEVAENAGFDVILTADKNIQYQQNIRGHKIAMVILSTSEREVIVTRLAEVIAAIDTERAGTFRVIDLES